MEIHAAPNVEPVPIVYTDSSTVYMWSWGTLMFKTPVSNLPHKIRIRVREDHAGDDFARCEIYSSNYLKYLVITKVIFDIYEFEIESISDSVHFFRYGNDYPPERNVELAWIEFEPMQSIPDTAKVVVSWDRNTEADLAGYNVYWGLKTGQYTSITNAGLDTFKLLAGLPFNRQLFFAVTAYDTVPNESGFSNEVDTFIAAQDTIPPVEFRKGDWNKDRRINLIDLIEYDRRHGATSNDLLYDAVFDFNDDGKINLTDMIAFDQVYGLIY
jgi:hypothetical protein